MEKPIIVERLESQMKFEVSESKKNGKKLDYYNHFIDFLEDQKERTLIKGNSFGGQNLVSKGFFGGREPIPYEIQQIEYGIKYLKVEQQKETGKIYVEQGTTRQTTLAFIYMQKAMKFPRKTGTNKTDSEFFRFLTGHSSEKIGKILGNPHKRTNEKSGKGTQILINDLKIVLNQFERIQFNKGVQLIENDIITLQNDLETFKDN